MTNIHSIVREQIELLQDETYKGKKPRRYLTVGTGFQARVQKAADLLAQYGYDTTNPLDTDGVNQSRVVEIALMLFLADHGYDKDLKPLKEVLNES